MSSGAMMPRARVVSQDVTTDLAGLASKVGYADPFEALVDDTRSVALRSVDTLQVAASLESAGVTDRAARVRFGYADVFDLADEVCRRVGPGPDKPSPRRARNWTAELRDIGHGLLYLLPGAVFPIAFGAVGREALVVGVLVAAALGWVWSGATAWLAYQMLGDGKPGSAGRLLRWSSLLALPVAALAGAAVARVAGAGYAVVVLAVAQMAYQMATTTLVLYRREILVFASMTPALAAGVWYASSGAEVLPMATALCLASVGLALGIAIWQTTRQPKRLATMQTKRQHGGDTRLASALRGKVRPLLPMLAFITLSAAFFLIPQGRHLLNRSDIAIAFVPVIAGMGIVEWRARLFGEEARALLTRVGHPRQFVYRVWGLVLSGLGICLVSVTALAGLMIPVVARTGQLTPAIGFMAAAGVLLTGAYYLGFLLANLGRFRELCGSLLLCAGLYAASGFVTGGDMRRDITALLAATTALIVLYLAALAGCVGQAYRHR